MGMGICEHEVWVCKEVWVWRTLVSGCGDEEADEMSRGESFRRLASKREASLSVDLSYQHAHQI